MALGELVAMEDVGSRRRASEAAARGAPLGDEGSVAWTR